MRNLQVIVYKEGKYFVSQCLNVEVSSFGETEEESLKNIKEALELYFEDEKEEVIKIESPKVLELSV